MRLFFLTSLLVLLANFYALAQEFKNIIAVFDGDKVKITYDLICDKPDQKFTLAVYGSHDQFKSKLINVIGDVGNNVEPGKGKSISWFLLTELPSSFDDNIKFKLVASPMVAGNLPAKQIQFTFPVSNNKAKKGKTLNIKWEGGNPSAKYVLELYSGDDKKLNIATTENTGSFLWQVPKDINKGKEYKLKLTNNENANEFIYSETFQIKAKMSKVIYAVPVAAAAVIVYFIFIKPPPPPEDLPPPINP